MKILTKRQWEKINDTVVNLQLDYNDVCAQLKLAEKQVTYLQEQIKKMKEEKEDGTERENV